MAQSVTYAIRPAAPGDAEEVAAIAARTFAAAYPELTDDELRRYVAEVLPVSRFRRVLERPDALVALAVARTGHCVGYMQVEPTDPPDAVDCARPLEVVRLYLLPEVQGAGLGSRLLAHALAWAREKGFDCCWLRAWDRNPPVVRFYRGHGFEIVADEPYTAGGMDDRVWIMRRPVN